MNLCATCGIGGWILKICQSSLRISTHGFRAWSCCGECGVVCVCISLPSSMVHACSYAASLPPHWDAVSSLFSRWLYAQGDGRAAVRHVLPACHPLPHHILGHVVLCHVNVMLCHLHLDLLVRFQIKWRTQCHHFNPLGGAVLACNEARGLVIAHI